MCCSPASNHVFNGTRVHSPSIRPSVKCNIKGESDDKESHDPSRHTIGPTHVHLSECFGANVSCGFAHFVSTDTAEGCKADPLVYSPDCEITMGCPRSH